MTTSITPFYTSETGVAHEVPFVQPIVSRAIRVNDSKYGLKTAAKKSHDRVARETFLAQKAAAIGKQHAREAARKAQRIADLDTQIAKIYNALVSGTASDERKSLTLYDTLVAKRVALV